MRQVPKDRLKAILALGLCIGLPANAQEPPRQVLQLTVDALRGDLPTQYFDNLAEGGFKFLLGSGLQRFRWSVCHVHPLMSPTLCSSGKIHYVQTARVNYPASLSALERALSAFERKAVDCGGSA